MDLRRLKTVLIFVLIAINIMFFALINNALNYQKEEQRTITESLTTLLSKNMIYLPSSIQLPDSPEISGYYIEKMFGSDKELLLKLLGSEYTVDQNVYSSSRGKLVLEGDEVKYFSNEPTRITSEIDEKQLENACRADMKRLGLMSDMYEFGGINVIDDGIRAIFTVQDEDYVFFDAYVSFDIIDGCIFAVSGRNLVSDVKVSKTGAEYLNITSILPDLIDNPKLEKNVSHTIVSITSGYYIGSTAESYRNILSIPVWQIATDSGKILYYDARNGQRIDE